MRKKLISFIGLAFTVGVVVTVQPLGVNNQTALSRFAANTLNSSESAQKTHLYSSTLPVSNELSNSKISVPGEQQQTAANEQQSIVHLKVSLSRRQITVYNGTTQVKTYPIAIGRAGHETPTGTFEIQQMRRNPTWIHPITDQRIKGGMPGNPLGTRWIGFWTDGRNWIGFHGTPNPDSVGQAASHGCLRMHNQDVEELFEQVEIGTLVTVVD